MAAVTPQTRPWMRPSRGSSDGVNDRQAKISAPQHPGRVACSCRRTLPGSAPEVGVCATPAVVGGRTAGEDWSGRVALVMPSPRRPRGWRVARIAGAPQCLDRPVNWMSLPGRLNSTRSGGPARDRVSRLAVRVRAWRVVVVSSPWATGPAPCCRLVHVAGAEQHSHHRCPPPGPRRQDAWRRDLCSEPRFPSRGWHPRPFPDAARPLQETPTFSTTAHLARVRRAGVVAR